MESKVGDIAGLDAQVFECLGVGIDDLVDELTLDFVAGCGFPPDQLVKELGDWFHDQFWDVQVAAFFEDFFVY